MPGSTTSSRARAVKSRADGGAGPVFKLLRGYYLARRAATGSIHPKVRRMREAREAFYHRVWEAAAVRAGAQLRALSDGILEIERGEWRLRVSGSLTSLDDPVTLQLAGDKPAVYRLLSKAGIPVPPHVVVDPPESVGAARLFEKLEAPLVVKPAADTGAGAGVSTNVVTPGQLRHALAWAAAFGRGVLVERQVEGDCYRILVLDDEVIDVVRRRPPRVVGDGRASIRRLIAAENERRLRMGAERAQVLIRADPDLFRTLEIQGLSLGARLPCGRAVAVKRVINDNSAEENEAANGELCDGVLDTAREAARLVGLRLAGVDVVCGEPLRPLEESGGRVLDVNGSPGFYYHYHRRGPSFAVADHLLRHAFARNLEHAW